MIKAGNSILPIHARNSHYHTLLCLKDPKERSYPNLQGK